jgi:hypothetical protein
MARDVIRLWRGASDKYAVFKTPSCGGQEIFDTVA